MRGSHEDTPPVCAETAGNVPFVMLCHLKYTGRLWSRTVLFDTNTGVHRHPSRPSSFGLASASSPRVTPRPGAGHSQGHAFYYDDFRSPFGSQYARSARKPPRGGTCPSSSPWTRLVSPAHSGADPALTGRLCGSPEASVINFGRVADASARAKLRASASLQVRSSLSTYWHDRTRNTDLFPDACPAPRTLPVSRRGAGITGLSFSTRCARGL